MYEEKEIVDDRGKSPHIDLGLILPNQRKRTHLGMSYQSREGKSEFEQQITPDALSKVYKLIGDREFITQLEKYGWKYDSDLMTLQKAYDSDSLLIQMDELKNIIEQFMVKETFLPSNKRCYCSEFAQKLEEYILLFRIQRQICQIQSVDGSLTKLDEHISPTSQYTKQIEKKIPKFYHGTEIPLINSSILSQMKVSLDQEQRLRSRLHFELNDDPNDPLTYILSIRGTTDVDKFCSKLRTYIISEISAHNLEKLVRNPRSFELDVIFENRDLGIELCPSPNARPRDHEGIWISNLVKDGQAQKILGMSAGKGAAIMMVNKIKVRDAKDYYDTLSVQTGNNLVVTICLSPYADLSDIEKHNLSGRNRIIVKRRNGKIEQNNSMKKKVQSEKGKQNLSFYLHFVEKFQAARDIEYKNSGILGQSANKSMWKQHKAIYGERCDELCRCPSDAKRISATVVKDYLNKHIKKGTSNQIDPSLQKGNNPVGFLNCFVGKFYDKVENEFPADTPKQTLDKLVGMWNLHKTERRFGLNCKSTCPCTEAWKNIFLNECVRIETKKAEKKKERNFLCRDDCSVQKGQVQKSCSNQLRKNKNISQYAVIFNPHKPLGFYCVTKTGRCVITSVFCSVKDKRISAGTIVHTSATHLKGLQEEKKSIASHSDLQNAYNAAKMKDNTRLKLWFTNTNNLQHSNSDDWSSTGAWKGDSSTDGWAGGASVAHSLERSSLKQMQREKSAEKQEGLKLKMRDAISRNLSNSKTSLAKKKENKKLNKKLSNVPYSAALPRKISPTIESSSNATEQLSIKYRSQLASKILSSKKGPENGIQERSLLKTFNGALNKNRTLQKKKVTFAKQLCEVKVFTINQDDEESKSSESTKIVEVDQQQFIDPAKNGTEQTPPTKSRENITNASKPIQGSGMEDVDPSLCEKDYDELIKVLKKDNATSKSSHLKKSLLSKIKDRIIMLNENLKDISNEHEKKLTYKKIEEFSLKQKAIKIFIQAEYLIVKAKTLDEWAKIEILPLSAYDIQLTKSGKYHDSSDYLFCAFKDEQKKNSMHNQMLPLGSNVDWTRVSSQKFQSEYNPLIRHTNEEKEIKIDLMKGKSSGYNVKLGTWSINLMELTSRFHTSPNHIISQEFNKSSYLSKGSMSVNFHCIPFNEHEVEEKKRETREEFSHFLEWIVRFGKDTHRERNNLLIDGNISNAECGNLSLLHAAVYLGDVHLINRLLHLGANPKQKSDIGDALNLATNIFDGKRITSEKYNIISKALGAEMLNANKIDASLCQRNDICDRSYQQSPTTRNSKHDHTLIKDTQINKTNNHLLNSSQYYSTDMRATDSNVHPQAQCEHHESLETNKYGATFESENDFSSLGRNEDQKRYGTDITSSYKMSQSNKCSNGEDSFRDKSNNLHSYHPQHEVNEPRSNLSNHESKIVCMDSENNDSENESDGWGSTPFGVAKFRSLNFLSQSSFTNSTLDFSSKSNQIEAAVPKKETSLPLIGVSEWADGRDERCPYFESGNKCRFGKDCIRAHVSPRLGNFMNDEMKLKQILNSEVSHIPISLGNFKRKRETNEDGELWFTAAYIDPETNIIYKAENKEGLESIEGIFWYKNGNAATTAAKHAYLISKYLEKKSNDTQFTNGKRKIKEEHAFRKKPKIIGENCQTLFQNLLKEKNLQNVFMKIHPKITMKKTCWKTKSISSDCFTASFESPAPQDDKKIFHPTNFDGKLIDGVLYYCTLQRAKAAAFYSYIIFCMNKGVIDENIVSSSTHKKVV